MNHKKRKNIFRLAATALLFSAQQSGYAQNAVIPPSYRQISQGGGVKIQQMPLN